VENLTPSRTALATSLMRAVHSRLDPHPLIQDFWGDLLVPKAEIETLRAAALGRMDAEGRQKALASPDSIVDQSLAGSRAFANVITRTRYTEDALEAAAARGVRQYVLIGAGFDSFALRRPAFARDLEIFEIDHPATQELKRRRIAACGQELPASVHFIAADFAKQSVADVLSGSSFRSDVASFFSWLGVTMYLTREANMSTLRSIASSALPGSEVTFTYLDSNLFDSRSTSFQAFSARVAALGEPLLSGFDPQTIARELGDCGLALIEDLDGDQVVARYGRPDLKSSPSPSASHIALARVVSKDDVIHPAPRLGPLTS
jgi:methyltransferase (TIGR00027 family)